MASASSATSHVTTLGSPLVMVPVLSKTMAESFTSISSTEPSLIRMPSWAPFPIPTMRAVGVARPSAQGHATQMTAMAGMSACCRRWDATSGSTKKNQMQKTHSAIIRMAGTKIEAILSAMRWMGAFDPWASSTARTMRANVESAPTRRARTVTDPVVFCEPPVTASPSPLTTGRVSPVSMDSSTSVEPSITTPSTGIFSPGKTMTVSPAATCARGISCSLPPRMTRAVGGVRFMRASIAWLVAPFALPSRIFPSKTNVTSMAQVSKYGIPSFISMAALPGPQSLVITGRNVI